MGVAVYRMQAIARVVSEYLAKINAWDILYQCE